MNELLSGDLNLILDSALRVSAVIDVHVLLFFDAVSRLFHVSSVHSRPDLDLEYLLRPPILQAR